MLRRILKLDLKSSINRYLPQCVTTGDCAPCKVFLTQTKFKHTPTCPVLSMPTGGDEGDKPLKRALNSGKCRMGFLPDEWFTFFYSKTGKSGGYVFLLVFANYCVSKEILVMEHEYYGGLSWIIVLYFISTKFGPGIGKTLDKQVDEVVADWEIGRKAETAFHETIIKDARLAQKRAEGQKYLMDAKKENILMQLEAIYRERSMLVYKTVKGRMDYHVKKYYAVARIEQKWMIEWILKNVMRAITPDFQKRALNQAIKDIERAASRA
ncbi:ATP synthase subunit b, mitochondrial-like [Pectinophora gossypiella]|nr:ATP synthase subunit b, mitochondrial-like [Pectinophora gossypiella]